MVAAGAVEDYPAAVLNEMGVLIANEADVPFSAVSLGVVPASVLITAQISATRTTQATVAGRLADALRTADMATAFFSSVSGGGVTILSTPTLVNIIEDLASSPMHARPPAQPPTTSLTMYPDVLEQRAVPEDRSVALIVVAIVSSVFGLILLLVLLRVLLGRREGRAHGLRNSSTRCDIHPATVASASSLGDAAVRKPSRIPGSPIYL